MVEATSADGIVEGIRPPSGERVLAVQWHPEWRVAENVEFTKAFAWFGMLLRGARPRGSRRSRCRDRAMKHPNGHSLRSASIATAL